MSYDPLYHNGGGRGSAPPIPERFASLSALVDYVAALPGTGGRSNTWSGGVTVAGALDLARHGWPEGAARAKDYTLGMTDKLARSAPVTELVIGHDTSGAAYDPGAYLSGVPECWGTLNPTTSKRAVRIVANIMASGGVPPEVLIQRGLAVCGLAYMLHSHGYPVTVDVTQGVVRPGDPCTVVTVADAASGSPLDLDRLTFALAHPSMLRLLLKSVTDGLTGAESGSRWDAGKADSNGRPTTPHDLFLGGAHLREVERWRDGGERWIIGEYLRQTGGGA